MISKAPQQSFELALAKILIAIHSLYSGELAWQTGYG